jgi:hypothetical protein
MSRYSEKVIEIEKQVVFIERKMNQMIKSMDKLHANIKQIDENKDEYGGMTENDVMLTEEIIQEIRKYEYFYINISKHMRKPLNDILKIKFDEVTMLKNLTRKLYTKLSKKRKSFLEKLQFIVKELINSIEDMSGFMEVIDYLFFRAQLDLGYAARAVSTSALQKYIKSRKMGAEGSELHLTAAPRGIHSYGAYCILFKTKKLRPFIHPGLKGKELRTLHAIPFSEWIRVYHKVNKVNFEKSKQSDQNLMKDYKLPFKIITVISEPKIYEHMMEKVYNLRRKYIKMYSALFKDAQALELAYKEVTKFGLA